MAGKHRQRILKRSQGSRTANDPPKQMVTVQEVMEALVEFVVMPDGSLAPTPDSLVSALDMMVGLNRNGMLAGEHENVEKELDRIRGEILGPQKRGE